MVALSAPLAGEPPRRHPSSGAAAGHATHALRPGPLAGPGLQRCIQAAVTLGRRLTPLALPLAVLLLWHLATSRGWVRAEILPKPAEVLATLQGLWADGSLFDHLGATLSRLGQGFALGTAAGLVLGAITGSFRGADRLIDPTLQSLRAVPSIAWVPLFILWFGIFETPKVLLIALGSFFPVQLGLSAAIRAVDRKLVEVARVHGLSRRQTVLRVLVPCALPPTLTAIRAGLGLGWMFVVAAELMGASSGLGFLMIDGQQIGRPDLILAALLLFAALGKLSDGLLLLASRRLTRWQDSFTTF